jgi:hypothetical protein
MKIVSLLLVILLICIPAVQAKTPETKQAAKIKANVQKRGVGGEKSEIVAQLVSGVEVRGYISGIEEVSFTVTDKKTGQTTPISYGDVQKIRGPGLSKGNKIAIGGVVAGVAVLAIVLGVGLYRNAHN